MMESVAGYDVAGLSCLMLGVVMVGTGFLTKNKVLGFSGILPVIAGIYFLSCLIWKGMGPALDDVATLLSLIMLGAVMIGAGSWTKNKVLGLSGILPVLAGIYFLLCLI